MITTPATGATGEAIHPAARLAGGQPATTGPDRPEPRRAATVPRGCAAACDPSAAAARPIPDFSPLLAERPKAIVMAAERAGWAPTDVDLTRPNVARMYDYFLGGAHNFQADRDAAEAVCAIAPEVLVAARANRAFLRRAVLHALDQGVRQFLDLGSGIPTVGNVHEIAHAADPTVRVVYVDAEPVVVAHARALLRDIEAAGIIQADIRDINIILGHDETKRLIDFDQPVCILLVSVLHFLGGDLTNLIGTLRGQMAAGSQLVISHASSAVSTAQTDAVQALYAATPTPLYLRSTDQIRGLFAGLDLVCPNPDTAGPADLVAVTRWRPFPRDTPPPPEVADSPFIAGFLAGVGEPPPPSTDPPGTPHTQPRPGVAQLAAGRRVAAPRRPQ